MNLKSTKSKEKIKLLADYRVMSAWREEEEEGPLEQRSPSVGPLESKTETSAREQETSPLPQ